MNEVTISWGSSPVFLFRALFLANLVVRFVVDDNAQ
jgi:hypothetical protein